MSKANACGTSVASQPPTTCTTNISHGRCRDEIFIILIILEGIQTQTMDCFVFAQIPTILMNPEGKKKKENLHRMGKDFWSRLPNCEFLWKTTQFLVSDEVTLLEPVAAIHRPWFTSGTNLWYLFLCPTFSHSSLDSVLGLYSFTSNFNKRVNQTAFFICVWKYARTAQWIGHDLLVHYWYMLGTQGISTPVA